MAEAAIRALLLEDEPIIAMDLEGGLGLEGFDVTSLMSSAKANDWLDRNRPDIAIVDIALRDGPCRSVVARLLEAKIPFVVYTGDYPSLHVGTPFAQGMWVGKPAAPDRVLAAVRAALGGLAKPAMQIVFVESGDLNELHGVLDVQDAP